MTWLNLLYIIIGVALVLWGADRLTEGASSLARGMRVPEIIIGLTIVAADIGTRTLCQHGVGPEGYCRPRRG